MTEPNDPTPRPPDDETAPPDRPRNASAWREPPWFPSRAHDRRERRVNVVSIVIGAIVLAIGLYYFLDRTLGIAMPRIAWGSLWPILLIVLGGLILFRSIERR
jgi:hypothetical protein